MATELNEKVIEAAKKFKDVLCSQCSDKVTATQRVAFSDAVLVRSIKEINHMLSLDTISPDVRAALEWVTYSREEI